MSISAGSTGTTSPTLPLITGFRAGGGPSSLGGAGGAERSSSRTSKIIRQTGLGQRMRLPRSEGSSWKRLWQWGQSTVMCIIAYSTKNAKTAQSPSSIQFLSEQEQIWAEKDKNIPSLR